MANNSGKDLTDSTGNQQLNGTNCNDTLIGDNNGAPDTLSGGSGNDTYYVYNSNELIVDNSGNDTVNVFCNNYNLSNTSDNLNIVLQGNTSNSYNNYYDTKYLEYGTEVINGTTYYLYQEYITQEGGPVTVYGNPMGWGNPDVTAIPTATGFSGTVTNATYNAGLNKLDFYQGDNNKGFYCDCGVVSCENVLIETGILPNRIGYTPSPGNPVGTAGNDSQESYIVNRAVQNGLCQVINGDPVDSGGTYVSNQIQILKNEGLSASSANVNLTQLAQYIKNNNAVIAEVDAYQLWYGQNSGVGADHAITVTGVAYDANNNIAGFYICDSGSDMNISIDSARFIDTALMTKAFILNGYGNSKTGQIVYTNTPKEYLDNGTITGNNQNDVITGNAGNDCLIAGNGSDTLVGGSGNDTLVAGTGKDYLEGGFGNDDYKFAQGFAGNDVVVQRCGTDDLYSGTNTLDFSSFDSNHSISVNLNNSTPYSNGASSTITISSYVYDTYNNARGLQQTVVHTVPTVIENVVGGAGADTIIGNNQNDILTDNGGSDYLQGGTGNDIYVFNPSTVSNSSSTINDLGGSNNIINFGQNINNLSIVEDRNNNLIIGYNNTSGNTDLITVMANSANGKNAVNSVNEILLSNGNYLTNADINAIIQSIAAYNTANPSALITASNFNTNSYDINLVATALSSHHA